MPLKSKKARSRSECFFICERLRADGVMRRLLALRYRCVRKILEPWMFHRVTWDPETRPPQLRQLSICLSLRRMPDRVVMRFVLCSGRRGRWLRFNDLKSQYGSEYISRAAFPCHLLYQSIVRQSNVRSMPTIPHTFCRHLSSPLYQMMSAVNCKTVERSSNSHATRSRLLDTKRSLQEGSDPAVKVGKPLVACFIASIVIAKAVNV